VRHIGLIKLNGKEGIMPNVDGKKFKYTKKGMAAAKKEAKKSGKKMSMTKGY
jgi:hypothetical protein